MGLCIFNEYIDGLEKECRYNYDCEDCKIKHDIGALIREILIEEKAKK